MTITGVFLGFLGFFPQIERFLMCSLIVTLKSLCRRRLSVGQKQLLTADVQIGGPVTIRIPTEASASASIVLSPILAGKETYHILSKDDARCKQSGATRDWFKVISHVHLVLHVCHTMHICLIWHGTYCFDIKADGTCL